MQCFCGSLVEDPQTPIKVLMEDLSLGMGKDAQLIPAGLKLMCQPRGWVQGSIIHWMLQRGPQKYTLRTKGFSERLRAIECYRGLLGVIKAHFVGVLLRAPYWEPMNSMSYRPLRTHEAISRSSHIGIA